MVPRRVIPALALVFLAAFSITAPPAWAAPARVGLVSFVRASTTTLTLSWPKASGATGYEIFRSLHEDMSSPTKVKTSTGTAATVTGMTPGKTYCFFVRGTSGSSIGGQSAHTCKPTIRAQSSMSGAGLAVMTFNACSQACSGWSSRLTAAKAVISNSERNPDVIAVQEAGAWTTPPSGYANAVYKSAKRLFYKTSRFTLARADYITMSTGKYAVWAELIDRSTNKRIIFVSAHTSPALADYPLRGRQIATLLEQVRKINTAGRTVVYAGDFNSHKNRGDYSESAGFGAQDSVGRTFAAAGYYDAYDLARNLKRPNWNSGSGFNTTPKVSYTWGDHVDHVYVKPGSTHVWRWMNAAIATSSRYQSPIPVRPQPGAGQHLHPLSCLSWRGNCQDHQAGTESGQR